VDPGIKISAARQPPGISTIPVFGAYLPSQGWKRKIVPNCGRFGLVAISNNRAQTKHTQETATGQNAE
jgi:hypothetical protein